MRRSFLSCDAARVLCVGALLLGVAAAPGFLRAESCFTIHDQKVVPGQVDVWFPVLLSNDQPIQGFQLMGVFDPDILTLDRVEARFSALEIVRTEFFEFRSHEEGRFEIGAIFDFEPPLTGTVLPAARDGRLLNLVFDVSPTAPVGTKTRIDLVNDDSLSPVFNLIIVEGFGVVLACLEGSTVEVAGGNPRLFLRGDADSNGELQITDAIRTLGFLFLGTAEPECLEAADTDDNGQIQLTDAIRSLNFSFIGGAVIPPPGPPGDPCGPDPEGSPDVGCGRYTGCE